MALGKNVKRLREAKGINQTTLAKMAGLSIGSLSALENRDSVRSEFAPQLARALGVPVEELITGETATAALTAPSAYVSASGGPGWAEKPNVVQMLSDALSSSPSKGSDALVGVLASLAKDPTNPVYQTALQNLLATDQATTSTATPPTPGFLKR